MIPDLLEYLQHNHLTVRLSGNEPSYHGTGQLSAGVLRRLNDHTSEIAAYFRLTGGHYQDDGPLDGSADSGNPVLAPVQQRLWYLHRMISDPAALNLGFSVRLATEINPLALQASVNHVLARHSALRTSFALESPAASVHASVQIQVNWMSLEDEVAEGQDRMAQRAFEAELRRPFLLDEAPLLRVGLIRLGGERHLLWVVAHSLVFDHFSADVFLEELKAFYEPRVLGADAHPPELRFGYSDFASWQHLQLEEGVWQADVDNLCNGLPRPLPVLDLPTDSGRPAVKTYAGQSVHRMLSHSCVESLRAFASTQMCSLPTVLMGAWGILLHRLTSHPAIIIGRLVDNRSTRGSRKVIGHFENIVPLLLRFEDDGPTDLYFQEVRNTVLHGAIWQHVPFEHVIEELDSARDLSRSTVCQTLFAYRESEAFSELSFSGSRMESLSVLSPGCMVDLQLTCQERPGDLLLALQFSGDLFTPQTAARILDRMEALLLALTENSSARVGDLAILPPSEQDLIKSWNETETDFPRIFLHQLFEHRVARTPSHLAIEFEGRRVSYEVLNALANRFARHLVDSGVTGGSLVGVFMDRTPEMIAALLGILKAGAGYVPLDPAYPRDRLSYIIQNSGLRFLACSKALVSEVPVSGLTCIAVDDPAARWQSGPKNDLDRPIEEDRIAYAIYTSGSTGKPKGVEISHRAAANFVHAMLKEPGFSSDERVLALTTISFDIAVLEIFVTLSVGATVVLASRDVAHDPRLLIHLVEKSNVTLIQATPATWRMLIDSGWNGRPGLRAITGGEAISPDLAEQLLDRCSEVWNQYGPTEVTVYATIWRIRRGERIVIGKPIANTTAFIVDSSLRQLPIGVPGELCLGGAQLANGYRGLPDRTAEKFITSSPSAQGHRIYRTGDLARFLGNGDIEYLGRIDHQVKIRGFRVELGEIESVLIEQPGVAKAVVVARDDGGGKRLAAYLVLEPSGAPAMEELRSALKEKLPDYMVPAHFVPLEAFPLTPNGKVDRLALPKPDRANDAVRHTVGARNAIERRLVEIWESVLNVSPIGIHDDFFELGGDSLLAVRIMVSVEESFSRNLALVSLFQSPTIAQLAATLREEARPIFSCVVPIQTQGVRPPLFLVHGVGGNVLGYHALASHLKPHQPVYGIQAVGFDGKCAPLDRVELMAAKYLSEVRKVQPKGPYFLGGLSLGGIVAFEMSHQLQRAGEEVGVVIMLDAYAYGVEQLADRSTRLRRAVVTLGRRAALHARNLSFLSLPEKVDYVRRKTATVKRRTLWAVRADEYKKFLRGADELPKNYNAVAHAAWTAMKNYAPVPFQGRILVIRAKEEPFLRNNDITLGWKDLVRPFPEIREVPGDHMSFLLEPYAQTAAEAILTYLREASHSRLQEPAAADKDVIGRSR